MAKLNAKSKRGWRRLALFLSGFVVAYIAGCYYLAGVYLRPIRWSFPIPKGLSRVTIPDVGNRLDPAWCTPNLAAGRPSDVVFIFAHGHGGSLKQFSGLMIDLAGYGLDSIEPSMPGQDDSPQREVGFGIKEAQMMIRAAEWVRRRRPNARIILAGCSLGGAAAWPATEENPSLIDGVVSEAAFANFPEAINTFFSHAAPGADVYLHPVVWFASRISGIRPEDIRPLDAALKWRGRPALVIAGAEDSTIPITHSQRLAEASGAPLWVIPRCGHAQGYEVAPKEYLARVLAFADRIRSAPR